MREFVVIYEQSATGWGAYCPDLPGLGVVGDTRSDAERLIKRGIELHVESLREHGEEVPEPSSDVGIIAVA
jgi:predicted RNase H-like HicB family nuclease